MFHLKISNSFFSIPQYFHKSIFSLKLSKSSPFSKKNMRSLLVAILLVAAVFFCIATSNVHAFSGVSTTTWSKKECPASGATITSTYAAFTACTSVNYSGYSAYRKFTACNSTTVTLSYYSDASCGTAMSTDHSNVNECSNNDDNTSSKLQCSNSASALSSVFVAVVTLFLVISAAF